MCNDDDECTFSTAIMHNTLYDGNCHHAIIIHIWIIMGRLSVDQLCCGAIGTAANIFDEGCALLHTAVVYKCIRVRIHVTCQLRHGGGAQSEAVAFL